MLAAGILDTNSPLICNRMSSSHWKFNLAKFAWHIAIYIPIAIAINHNGLIVIEYNKAHTEDLQKLAN